VRRSSTKKLEDGFDYREIKGSGKFGRLEESKKGEGERMCPWGKKGAHEARKPNAPPAAKGTY